MGGVSWSQSGVTGECAPANLNHFNTTLEKNYKINFNTFDSLLGFDEDTVRNSVLRAADMWNEQANAGTFRFIGAETSIYTENQVPDDLAGCNSLGIYHSFVIVEDAVNDGGIAQALPKCGGTQFVIRLWPENKNSGVLPWTVGEIGWNEIDTVGVLGHEFGHTLNLGHPQYMGSHNDDVYAVMDEHSVRNTTRMRDLYQWDQKCAYEISGTRELFPYSVTQISDGTFLQENPYHFFVSSISAGITYVAQQLRVSFAEQLACTRWWTDGSTEGCVSFDERNGIGPTEGTRIEDTEEDWMYSGSWYEQPAYGEFGRRLVQFLRSTDGFATYTGGYLSRCNHMSGWMECTHGSRVRSGKEISTAWEPGFKRTITAWANQNRQNDQASREVLVAVGYTDADDRVVPVPDSMGVRSAIPPEVACGGKETAGGYDCLLAYVDETDPSGSILILRFTVYQGADRFHINLDSVKHEVQRETGTRVALWYNEGTSEYYLALRDSFPWQIPACISVG